MEHSGTMQMKADDVSIEKALGFLFSTQHRNPIQIIHKSRKQLYKNLYLLQYHYDQMSVAVVCLLENSNSGHALGEGKRKRRGVQH